MAAQKINPGHTMQTEKKFEYISLSTNRNDQQLIPGREISFIAIQVSQINQNHKKNTPTIKSGLEQQKLHTSLHSELRF